MSMKLDPELMKQLIEVFRSELDEKLQSLTEGLLRLEKGLVDTEYDNCLDQLFRDAHNIKGAARGVDITAISDIAHGLETLFSILKKDKLKLEASTIDRCLLSIDHMREAMIAFETGATLQFDLPDFLAELDNTSTVDGTVDAKSYPDELSADSTPLATLAEKLSSPHQVNELIRVSHDKLDRISTLVEALLSTKIEQQNYLELIYDLHKKLNQIAQSKCEFSSNSIGHEGVDQSSSIQSLYKQTMDAISLLCSDSLRVYKHVKLINNRISQTTHLLDDQVRLMRLVPVSSLLRPLERSVRDIAKELGKLIDYKIVGDDIEIDRLVLAGLKDPLVHLLRNAIDHGIESSTERQSIGKTAVGTICITVSVIGSRFHLSIQDDGSGINVDKIRGIAVQKKIISAVEAECLSVDEKLNLIFSPGFSTKEIITNVSGRGVGLDVVLSGITEMKGQVHVETEVGKGTTFSLNLPLMLSADRGLMIRESDTMYIIPTSAVARVMVVNASALFAIQSGQSIIFQEKAIPAYELSELLDLETSGKENSDCLSVVIIKNHLKYIALMVDEVMDERELVIKPLQPPLFSVRNVAGGTLVENGEIIIVLNPGDLLNSAMQCQTGVIFKRSEQSEKEQVNKLHILIVDDSITTRTLEKNILELQGYQVTVAVNGKEGWDALSKDKFDLVVTDIEMPEMNGFELTEQIKTSEAYRQIPVVIVTSLASGRDRQRGVQVGADAYIVKGQFETTVLLDVIHQLI